MKRSSLFLIIVIYVISIVAISFFGQAIEMGQFLVRVNYLEITNESEVIPGSDNIRNISLSWDEEQGYSSVFIYYTYLPEDASDPSVTLHLDGDVQVDAETGEEIVIAQVAENTRQVVFLHIGIVTAYITTVDGSNITDSIRITCR